MNLRIEEATEIDEPTPAYCLFCGGRVEWKQFVVYAGPGLSEDICDCPYCGHVVSLRSWKAFRHGDSR